ncbi:MAG: DMT family transporter [Mesorhizobium sp.]|nr:DMT family transporter [Mesorhizobium sp.]MCO5160223.1 DMT family transporter [Mesorhizobium sp.]
MMILAGGVLPLQFALNAMLARSAGSSSVMATMVSLSVSFLCIVGLLLATRQSLPPMGVIKTVPMLYWLGGVGGAIFVAMSTFGMPRLGAAACVSLALVGQLATSAVLDHFGLLGMQQQAISWQRLLGIGLVLAGAFVLR